MEYNEELFNDVIISSFFKKDINNILDNKDKNEYTCLQDYALVKNIKGEYGLFDNELRGIINPKKDFFINFHKKDEHGYAQHDPDAKYYFKPEYLLANAKHYEVTLKIFMKSKFNAGAKIKMHQKHFFEWYYQTKIK